MSKIGFEKRRTGDKNCYGEVWYTNELEHNLITDFAAAQGREEKKQGVWYCSKDESIQFSSPGHIIMIALNKADMQDLLDRITLTQRHKRKDPENWVAYAKMQMPFLSEGWVFDKTFDEEMYRVSEFIDDLLSLGYTYFPFADDVTF